MDFGLEQPRGVAGGDVFYFTPEGEAQHKRMIDLLSKASKKGVVRKEVDISGSPTWESGDGQFAVKPEQASKAPDAALESMKREKGGDAGAEAAGGTN